MSSKPPRRRRAPNEEPPTGPWMYALAHLAAASRTDGGEGLQRLLRRAKWSERTRVSITKREAA